jgi:hypothetical protein
MLPSTIAQDEIAAVTKSKHQKCANCLFSSSSATPVPFLHFPMAQ